MALDIAVLYRWPDGTAIVRALTRDTHEWLTSPNPFLSGRHTGYRSGWTPSQSPMFFLLDAVGQASTVLCLHSYDPRALFLDYWGPIAAQEADRESWYRFLVDALGVGKIPIWERMKGQQIGWRWQEINARERGVITLNADLYRLLGINPLLLPLDEFLPWWRGLQAAEGAP